MSSFSTLKFPCIPFLLICRNMRVLSACYFSRLVHTVLVTKMKKKKVLYWISNKFLFATFYKLWVKNVKLKFDFRDVSENFDAEILSNFDSVRSMLKKSPSEFKFEEVLAEKRWKRFSCIKILSIYMCCFLIPLCLCHLYGRQVGNVFFSCDRLMIMLHYAQWYVVTFHMGTGRDCMILLGWSN